ncbi:hypothetical protein Tco_0278608 [Tanacetum coccineum]
MLFTIPSWKQVKTVPVAEGVHDAMQMKRTGNATTGREPTMVAGDDDDLANERGLCANHQTPTLKTSSNTSRANQDNTPRINRGTGYDNQRVVNFARARENLGTQVVQQSGIQDDTDDEPGDQELEAHYLYMAQIQEVTPDAADNSGPIFNVEPLQKVQNNDDNYNLFSIESEHPEQPESVNDTYPVDQDEHNIIINSLDMSYDREHDDQDDDDLANERESSNKALVDKLKGKIEDFNTKNKSLESSNNHFKEANNELSKTNQLMFKDPKKFQAELDRYHDVNYASKVAIYCEKAKGDLISSKIES